MKETIFASIILCFLAGCAETGGQKRPAEKGKQAFIALPVELQVPSEEPIPVKVQWQEGKAKPVKVEVQSDKALPVDVNIGGDRGLLVEVKLPWVALIFMSIFGVTILFIAIVSCFAAIAAARSARVAYQSADAIRKLQQQSESNLHAAKKD